MILFAKIIIGTLPSLIWLIFYLHQDKHPESKKMILKVFCYGMLIAFPAILLETGLLKVSEIFLPADMQIFTFSLVVIVNALIGVALVEEVLKYFVVREAALRSPEFDEPMDAMIYMIVSALGFAALENILVLLSLSPAFEIGGAISVITLRFIGATLLHALTSGVLGYFLALSFFGKKKRVFVCGLLMVVLLHGLFNFSIIEIEGWFSILIPVIILVFLAIFIAYAFNKVKKIKSVCKIY